MMDDEKTFREKLDDFGKRLLHALANLKQSFHANVLGEQITGYGVGKEDDVKPTKEMIRIRWNAGISFGMGIFMALMSYGFTRHETLKYMEAAAKASPDGVAMPPDPLWATILSLAWFIGMLLASIAVLVFTWMILKATLIKNLDNRDDVSMAGAALMAIGYIFVYLFCWTLHIPVPDLL